MRVEQVRGVSFARLMMSGSHQAKKGRQVRPFSMLRPLG